MAIESAVAYDFLHTFIDSIDVLYCCLPGVVKYFAKH